MKWPNDYRCERCGCIHHYTTATRKLTLYQCRKCGYQATVIVNTILEKTRTELGKWFLAVYSMAADKRGISATQLAKDNDVSYPTAWLMLHKIRNSMSDRDCKCKSLHCRNLSWVGPKDLKDIWMSSAIALTAANLKGKVSSVFYLAAPIAIQLPILS